MTSLPNTHLWPGVPLAVGAALSFGSTAPLSKLLMGVIDPWLLAAILYLGAGVGLSVVVIGRRLLGLSNSEAPLRKPDLPWLVLVILSGGVLAPVLLMLGLSRTTAGAGSLLLNLEGLATMLIAWLLYRENVDGRVATGAMLILAGALVLSWTGEGIRLDSGGLLVAAACICWGIDNNLTRRLSSADPLQIALLKGLFAGSVNLGLALYLGAEMIAPRIALAGAAVGFVGVGLSLVMFMLALRHLGTARTGAYFSLAPFVGAAAAVLGLGEPLTWQMALAGLLMALGVYFHLAERHEHEHEHEFLEHEHSHVHDEHHQHDHGGDPIIEPHSHIHRHGGLRHSHVHYPDLHHRHNHG